MSEYTITYTYDGLNRVIREDYTDGSYIEYAYNAKGQLTRKTVVISDDSGSSVRLNQPIPMSVAEIEDIVARLVIDGIKGVA